MIDSVIQERCTGCEACASSCPKNCIEMKPDSEGFKQPVVDSSKCINCRKCLNICPVLNFKKNHKQIVDMKKAYAYRTKYEEYREICSSGGVFLALSNVFIQNGGIVYGAAFDKNFRLSHRSATTSEELVSLAGSKYLQSDINDTFKKIKENLNCNKKVLFFGMTCQIEGLHAFLGKSYDSLFCVDLICMGIPSPMVWDRYLKTYYGKKVIKKINFKDKHFGWHQFSFYLENEDGSSETIKGFDNVYMECMFKGYSIRNSCFNCIYKCENKIADLTIADCWGCENYVPELDDNRGLSMIIVHSQKGITLLEMLKDTGILKEFAYENVLKYNSNYNSSTIPKAGRKKFYKLLKFTPKIAFELMGQNPNKTYARKILDKFKKWGN